MAKPADTLAVHGAGHGPSRKYRRLAEGMGVTTCIAMVDGPVGRFLLAEVLQASSGLVGRLGPTIAQSKSIHSYLSIEGMNDGTAPVQTVGGGFVGYVEPLDEGDLNHVYRVQWTADDGHPFASVDSDNVTILGGISRNGTWRLTMQFDSGESLESFRRRVTEDDGGWQIHRVLWSTDTVSVIERLTPVQRETLETAVARGYFDIPRGISTTELADELGVTTNAVSERLRRAEREVFDSMLGEGMPTDLDE